MTDWWDEGVCLTSVDFRSKALISVVRIHRVGEMERGSIVRIKSGKEKRFQINEENIDHFNGNNFSSRCKIDKEMLINHRHTKESDEAVMKSDNGNNPRMSIMSVFPLSTDWFVDIHSSIEGTSL